MNATVNVLAEGFTDARQPVLVHHPRGLPPGGHVAGHSGPATDEEAAKVRALAAGNPRRHSHVLHYDRATLAPAGEFRDARGRSAGVRTSPEPMTTRYAHLVLPNCLAALYGGARISVPDETDTGEPPADRATLTYTDGLEETGKIPHEMAHALREAAHGRAEAPPVTDYISAVQDGRSRRKSIPSTPTHVRP